MTVGNIAAYNFFAEYGGVWGSNALKPAVSGNGAAGAFSAGRVSAGRDYSVANEPAYLLELSPEGRQKAAEARGKAPELDFSGRAQAPQGSVGAGKADPAKPTEERECQTCKNRKYVDGSDDASVSFQTPTRVSPEAAASKVAAHEHEHVRNEQADAKREGRRVVSQSVTIKTDICPECGRVYVSGGETKTVTANAKDIDKAARERQQQVAGSGDSYGTGDGGEARQGVDMYA
jgi:Zn-finger nucleic acid-binding protein